MTSHLRRLYASLATEVDLNNLITDKREEDLYLEFKQKADRRHGNLDDSDKKAFSKALSGFANADGGILVFGVETAKSQDGIDRAVSLKSITDHLRFRAKLLDSILNTTQPVVDDVLIDAISSENSPNAGYIKCLIPQSIKPPHRAILADHLYWRRISTGHRRMEHYELEDVFGRRLRPSLMVYLELRPRGGNDLHEEVHFFILNVGRGSAHHAGFLFKAANVTIEAVTGAGLQNEYRTNDLPSVSYYDALRVFHPNGLYSALGYATLRRVDKGAPLLIEIILYAENMETRHAKIELLPGKKVSFESSKNT